jgi:hypothetical protein
MGCGGLSCPTLLEAEVGQTTPGLHVNDPSAPIPRSRVVIGIAVDHHAERSAGICVGIPAVVGLEAVAVIAQEARVIVPALHMVCTEVQPISNVFPIRNQGRHIIVHSQVGVPVDLPAYPTQVPAPSKMGVAEVPKIEGLGRSDDEEIPHPRIVLHIPIG